MVSYESRALECQRNSRRLLPSCHASLDYEGMRRHGILRLVRRRIAHCVLLEAVGDGDGGRPALGVAMLVGAAHRCEVPRPSFPGFAPGRGNSAKDLRGCQGGCAEHRYEGTPDLGIRCGGGRWPARVTL